MEQEVSTKHQSKPGIIRRIIRGIAATFRFIRITIANVLVVLFLIVIIALLLPSEEAVVVKQGSILVFTPAESLVEQRARVNPWLDLFLADYRPTETGVHETIRAIKKAADDPRIVGLEIRPDRMTTAGLVHIEMLSRAITQFRENGKFVFAYAPEYSQQQYLLASYANEIYMHPMGSVYFTGIAFKDLYFKQFIDKLHVNVHTFRSGPYKSGIEPYTRDSMSDVVKESYEPIVQQLWQSVSDRISTNRTLDLDRIEQFTNGLATLIEQSGSSLAQLAVDFSFIDGLGTRSEIEEKMSARSTLEHPRHEVSVTDYYSTLVNTRDVRHNLNHSSDKSNGRGTIAVITVEGPIIGTSGSDGLETIDATGAVENLRQAIEDQADAIVLRIDSPGGGVLASEAIRQQIQKNRELGTPIVVSMSGLAASGGYWIAAEADHILAEESTITGSIGVYSFIPTIEESLEKVGVNTDGVYSFDGGIRLDTMVGLSTNEKVLLQASVDDSYRQFLKIVSDGRNIPLNETEDLAGGRIWSGKQALANGLIDELGSIDRAIQHAAELAKLSNFSVEFYSISELTAFTRMLGWIEAKLPFDGVHNTGDFLRFNTTLEYLEQRFQFRPGKVYAMCELCSSN